VTGRSAPRHEDRTARPVLAFGTVTLAFLAVTIAESLLPPLYPVLADELGMDLSTAGMAFGLLTGSIAVGNFAGGFLLARRGPRAGITTSAVVVGAGSLVAATAGNAAELLVSQVLVGLGAGVFFPPGINAAGRLVPAHRRGLAMGLFGLAFSGGLALAAGLAAVGARLDWRATFGIATVTCVVAAVVTTLVRLPTRPLEVPGGRRRRLREAVGVAAAVGGVGAASQYGTVSLLPVFAVAAWEVSPAYAAGVLAIGRLISAPAKVVVGWTADRWSAATTVHGIAILLAVTGVGWVLLPFGVVSVAAAALFTAGVSAVFPVANLLAVEGFGDRGPLLGTFRAAQIGIGAAAAAVLAPISALLGLRPVLLVAAVGLPGMLFAVRRRPAATPVDVAAVSREP
jgi:NNP family nitrate/nitrite transporter-like MFS transporter